MKATRELLIEQLADIFDVSDTNNRRIGRTNILTEVYVKILERNITIPVRILDHYASHGGKESNVSTANQSLLRMVLVVLNTKVITKLGVTYKYEFTVDKKRNTITITGYKQCDDTLLIT